MQQKNRGPGAARNLGASKAKGEYLCFLDSDDLWFPWTLSAFRRAIEEHGAPAVITSMPVMFVDPAKIVAGGAGEQRMTAWADFYSAPPQWFYPSGSAIKRSEFERVGGFTEGPSEDTDLWLRLGASPGFVRIDTPVGFAYREHPGGISKRPTVQSTGALRLIDEENAGHYPGGNGRRAARMAYISMHTRALSIYCLRQGMFGAAWRMYGRMFLWHVRLVRIKYLCALPILTVGALGRKLFRGEQGAH